MTRTRDELRGNMIMSSGQIDTIVVADNIQMLKVADSTYEDMFVRVGPHGFFSLYRAPDQDVHWVDTDNQIRDIGTTPLAVISITPDLDVLTTDGSYQISGMLSNNRNQIMTVTMSVHMDDVEFRTEDIILATSQKEKLFVFNGQVKADITAGSVITVLFSTDRDDEITLDGDITETKIDLIKAKAAPVAAQTGYTGELTIKTGPVTKTISIEDGIIVGIN